MSLSLSTFLPLRAGRELTPRTVHVQRGMLLTRALLADKRHKKFPPVLAGLALDVVPQFTSQKKMWTTRAPRAKKHK